MKLFATRGRISVYDKDGKAFIRRIGKDAKEWLSPDRTSAEWVELNNYRKDHPWTFA